MPKKPAREATVVTAYLEEATKEVAAAAAAAAAAEDDAPPPPPPAEDDGDAAPPTAVDVKTASDAPELTRSRSTANTSATASGGAGPSGAEPAAGSGAAPAGAAPASPKAAAGSAKVPRYVGWTERGRFANASSVAFTSKRELIVCDAESSSIKAVSASGVVRVIAGGVAGCADGPYPVGKFNAPQGICIDAKDNIIVAGQSIVN
jgi:hypothetical protein